jgi:plasmid stabilization system protein ParE
MIYTFHPHAERELEEVQNYYASIRNELGESFRSDVSLTLSRILQYPSGWQSLSGIVRRCRLTHFPYIVLYRVKANEIRILAVMHQRREPKYWQDRT